MESGQLTAQLISYSRVRAYKTHRHAPCPVMVISSVSALRLLTSPARSCRRARALSSVHQDSYIDAIESKKRARKSAEFDTLGTWDTRLNVKIDEDATLRTGHIVPSIEADMVGRATHLGRRNYQEDRYCVQQLRPDLLYLAVFDGHGGEECAEYCSQNFHSHLLHHLDREDDLGLVLEKSFHDVNRSYDRWYHGKKEHLNRATSSGSTATVCLLQDNLNLHIGHCGDSRALLCREGQARPLTRDHCPSDAAEARRIKEAGGTIVADSIGRTMVNGRLCMTRSIGDLELKEFGVTAVPEVKSVRIRHGKDQFLVVFSDGVSWVMQDNEVVEAITKCEDAQDAATRLVDHALLYSCQDNATALVLPLGSWGKGEGTSGMFYSFGRAMSNSSRFG